MASKQSAEAAESEAHADTATAVRRRSEERHELRTAATASAREVTDRAHKVRFELTCDIAYHAIREQFFARLNRFLTGAQVLLGTSAVAAIVSEWPNATVYLVAISAIAGVLLLVADPAGSARDHRSFRTRLQSINASLEEFGDTEEALRSSRAARMRVAGEAPPAYRAISALAYNTAINSIYEEEAAALYRYKIGFWRRLAANWFPMRGTQFQKD